MTQWLPWVFLGLALLVVAGIRVRLLDFPLERDEGEYAYAGQLIQEGIPPYKLAYNMKMPGTYLAYAAIMSVFGQTPAGIHLGLLIVHLATLGVLFLIARKFLDLAGAAVATAAFGIMTLSPSYLGLAAHATHFVMLPALLGYWVLFGLEKRGGWWRCLAAGGLFGTAFLMKQQGVFFGVFGGLFLGWLGVAGRLAWRRLGGWLGWYALGCLLPFLLVCGWLKIAGVFPAFWFWTVTYAREYVGIMSFHDGATLAKSAITSIVGSAPLLWIVSGLGLVCLCLTRQAAGLRVFLAGLLFFSGLAVCPGYYFRGHYFIVLAPAVALLAGLAVTWSGRWLARFSGSGLGCLPLLIAGVGCCQSLYFERAVYFRLSPAVACQAVYQMSLFPESAEIARHIEEDTGPNDRIVVLGSEPQIYFQAHRHSSTGYIYTYPLMEAQPFAREMQTNMIREIEQNPPAYLVLVSIPPSWSVQPDSSPLLLNWLTDYLTKNMQQVGLIQPHGVHEDADPSWGPAAVTKPIRTDFYAAVFKRLGPGDSPDRSRAAARNQLLRQLFDDGPIAVEINESRELVRRRPNDADAHKRLAFALDEKGLTNDAIAQYQEAVHLRPDFFDARNNLGVDLLKKGQVDTAIEEFQETLRLDPSYAKAHDNLGLAFASQGRMEKAAGEFQEAIRRVPDFADAYNNLGLSLVKLGRGNEAMTPYREAVRLKPDDAIFHYNLGNLLASQGQVDQAIEEFRAALNLKPGFTEAQNNLTGAMAANNQIKTEQGQYQQAVRLKPEDAKAHNDLGLMLAGQGRPDEAVRELREALRINPDYAEAHDNLGIILAGQGSADKAMVEYQAALRLEPGDAVAHDNLGNLLASQGKSEAAIEHYQEAIRLKPGYAKAHDNLGMVLARMGRTTEAASEFEEALRLNPDYAKAHDNLGQALVSGGQTEAAIHQFQEAIRLQPDYPAARSHLAQVLAAKNGARANDSSPVK